MRKLGSEMAGLYRETWRTYFAWARTLIPLAVIVFVPLGLIHAIPAHAEVQNLDFDGGLQILGIAIAVIALSAGSLIGEVFYAGAVAIALTHPHEGRPPTLREVAKMIDYRRLIAVDLIYAAAAAIGFAALIVPGILVYIYFGLAAPAAEIEKRTIKGAFRRSLELVRGHFWLVVAVLVPIELLGNVITGGALALSHDLINDTILDEWFADTVTNVLFTPFYAVAAVLLTLKLIGDADGRTPGFRPTPPSP
ncbi:MAG TPA: hypothetical protein VIT85_06275 [Solirubrobacterales bacterium]